MEAIKPLKAMWLNPKTTISYVLETDINQSYRLLFVLLCVEMFVAWTLNPNDAVFTKYPMWFLFSIALPLYIIGAIIAAWIAINLDGAFARLIGGWLGGTGYFKELKIAGLWAIYPTIVISIIINILILLLHVFLHIDPIMAVLLTSPFVLLNGLYSLFLNSNVFSVVHQFSFTRGLILALILHIPSFIIIVLSLGVLALKLLHYI